MERNREEGNDDRTVRRRTAGSALIETLVSLPLLLLVVLGAVQWGLIFEAKSTLEYAALMAARAGSVSHADAAAIRNGLARGLLPLYSPPKTAAGALRTMSTRVLPDVLTHTRIRILNPTVEAFSDFAEVNDEGVSEIPNLDLHRRPVTRGAASGVNIQDANLLKVEVLYGYELKVPLVGPLIASVARWWSDDPRGRAMLARRRIPILASSLVRMQSAARKNDLMIARNGSLPGESLPGGGVAGGGEAGSGGDAASGGGQNGAPNGAPGGGWSPVIPASLSDPVHASPRPGTGGGAPDGEGSVPPIADDPGAGQFARCEGEESLAAVTPSQPAQQTGNPIHVVTGNKYQRETDIRPLPGVLGLRFIRHYNSRVHRAGPMGFGWRHSFQVELEVRDAGHVLLHQADGRTISFGSRAPPRERPAVTPVAYAPANDAVASPVELTAARIEDGALEILPRHRGYRWRWPGGRSLHFDHAGRLRTIKNRGGSTLYLSYDPRGRLAQVQDPQKRALLFFYDPYDRLVRITDPGGLHTDYVYDAHNNLTEVHYADQARRTYHYEDPRDVHNLTGITDGRGIRFSTYAYDDQDRAVLSTHADHVGKVTLQYEPDRTRVTDSQGRTSIYHTVLTHGVPLVTRIDGPGCTPCDAADVRYTYNDHLQVTKMVRLDGSGSRYTYDTFGRLTRVYGLGVGGVERDELLYAYQDDTFLPAVISEPSVIPGKRHSLLLAYDDRGRIIGVLESGARPDGADEFHPVFREWRFSYRGDRLIAQDGPLPGEGDAARIEYDQAGLVRRVVRPEGLETEIQSRDAYGRPVRVRDPDGLVTTFTYNSHGQVIEQRMGALAYHLEYGPEGHPLRIVRPDGSALSARYDAAGRLVALRDAAGNRVSLQRDTRSHVIAIRVQDDDGQAFFEQRSSYGERGLLRTVQTAAGTTERAYDASGNVSRLVALGGRVALYRHDPFGRLQERTDAANTSAEASTSYLHDVHDILTALTDARGNTTRLVYDDFGLKVAEISPDAGVTLYRYDVAGRLIARIDERRVITQYRYDNAGRMTGFGPPKQKPSVTFEYQGARLSARVGPNQSSRYRYDHQGRMVRKWEQILGRQFITEFRYDSETGRLREKVLPDGQVLRYHYDPETGALRAITRKELIGQTPIIGELRYAPFGPLRSYAHGNGVRTLVRYDRAGRIVGIEAGTTQKLEYQYDEAGDITGIKRNNQSERYGYDDLGRLSSAHRAGDSYKWTYDKLGNRLSETRGTSAARTLVYDAKSSRLLSTPEGRYRYDSTGNPIQAGGREYIFDGAGRLRAVYEKDEMSALYTYNSRGQRIAKTVPVKGRPSSTLYLYEGDRLIAEADETGTITKQYLYLEHRPVAVLIGRDIYFVHTDHLGTPLRVTDENADLAWKAEYEPFGAARISTAKITFNLRFPGQYFDPETGQHYNQFRYYQPDTGRYLTSDPLGVIAGDNPYRYAGSSPVMRMDPLGLYDEAVHYYMTYFLAVVAGLPERQAKTIALAAQYVDDNPRTSPTELPGMAMGAWSDYHFVLDYDSTPFYGDHVTSDPMHRFEYPASERLKDLERSVSTLELKPCLKSHVFGIFLHAFQDTFAHRDRFNRPYATENDEKNDPAGGIGHLAAGWGDTFPDKTYNQYRETRVSDVTAVPGNSRYFVDEWAYNELRTLEMEKEVLSHFLRKFEGGASESIELLLWERVAGDGGARLGVPDTYEGVVDDAGYVVHGYQPAGGVQGVLQEFNQFNENLPGNSLADKVGILSAWLKSNGFEEIPPYDKNAAKAQWEAAMELLER